MRIPAQFVAPYTPRLDHRSSSPAESEAFNIVESCLSDLAHSSMGFTAAVLLHEECFKIDSRERDDPNRSFPGSCPAGLKDFNISLHWSILAGREGGLMLRNYRMALGDLRGTIGKIAWLLPLVDVQLLKSAWKTFEEYFPDVDNIRHAIAHPEYFSDPKKNTSAQIDNHFVSENVGIGPGNYTIQDSFFGDRFTTTIDGRFLSYPLNSKSAEKLVDLTKQSFDSFAGASSHPFPGSRSL